MANELTIPVGELSVRRATEADTEAILGLLKLSLGQGKIPREAGYWAWKHVDNPFGPSPCLLAEAGGAGGELVGLRVFMRWAWRAGEHTLPAVRAVDTATHPDWRGRGIFSRLTRALLEQMAAEGVRFVFNTPNAISKAGYLKLGWAEVGRTTLWIRPVQPLRVARAALAGGIARHGRPAQGSPLAGIFPRAGELLDEPGLEAFLAGQGEGDGRLWTPRSRDYLRWRYQEIPGFDYHAAWELEGERGAVLIFRGEQQGALHGLRLCELLVGPGSASRRSARSLLRGVLRAAGADFAAAMAAPRTPEARVLLGSAFLPVPRLGPVLTVRPLAAGNGIDPLRRPSWRLAIGDVELF